jgi:hypothetical protein
MRWVEHVTQGEIRGAYSILVERSPKRRRKGNINIDLQEVGLGRHALD